MEPQKWPLSIGMGGRFGSERVAGFNRNARPLSSGFHNCVNKNMPKVHKRLSVFHESGHDTMPTHRASALSCHGKDLEPTAHKQMEKEAFLCGAELMFPLKPFVTDSTSMTLGTDSIQKLAQRYKASIEATAIRYAATNQDVMAMLMVQPTATFTTSHATCITCSHHPEFPFQTSYTSRPNGQPSAPLRVQYFVRSYRFPKFISSGTEIREGNIIFDAWQQGIKKTGEIHASALRSSAACNYFAECQPLPDGRIMVLIWLPNKQLEFLKGVL